MYLSDRAVLRILTFRGETRISGCCYAAELNIYSIVPATFCGLWSVMFNWLFIHTSSAAELVPFPLTFPLSQRKRVNARGPSFEQLLELDYLGGISSESTHVRNTLRET
jgi:hypothetical protein